MEIKINGLKLVNHMWFTARNCVGIVLCEDTITGEHKAYIGGVKGENEKVDLVELISWGAKFPVDMAKTLMRVN